MRTLLSTNSTPLCRECSLIDPEEQKSIRQRSSDKSKSTRETSKVTKIHS